MTDLVRVLVVDDSEDDCLLAIRELERAGLRVEWERVEDETGLRSAIERQAWHVALLDHAMPRFDGSAALALVLEIAPDTIPIVVSGSIGEERAVDAIRRGAKDYVLKDRLLRLPAAVDRELGQADERRALREAELRVRDMARQDAVTGLANRGVLEEAIATCLGSGTKPCAVVVVEIDRFASVLHAFGHSVGDDVLRVVARRIAAMRPANATLASLGNHDFGVLLPDANADRALAVAETLRAAFDEPLVMGGVPIRVEASLGIASSPGHGDHASVLLRNASFAMHEARSLGRTVSVYRPRPTVAGSEELILLGELRAAIEARQLVLEYQPVIDLKAGAVVAAEALVRWDHPRRGRVPPGSFVPQAENCALIQPLTRSILHDAIAWNAEERSQGRLLRVAVNVATRNLLDHGFAETVRDELARASLPPDALEIEITEGALMADPANARATLDRLRELGVHLAIDDFGTGYSSFAYLRDLPVQTVKIDRTFVSRLTQGKSDAAIVQGIIDLAHTLGLVVVAEGVEDQMSVDLLSAFGCDLVQGYHVSKPMSAVNFRAWHREWELLARGHDPERRRDGART
jgi:diguanylate cyclase